MSQSTTVMAEFSWRHEFGRDPEKREVVLEMRADGWVWMRGGPTGYESFHPGGRRVDRDWTANVGDRRYANCVVRKDDLNRALRELGAVR